jgi:hypothetical protein
MELLILAIGLTIGNFIGVAITDKNWDQAIDRTVFQLIALTLVYFIVL